MNKRKKKGKQAFERERKNQNQRWRYGESNMKMLLTLCLCIAWNRSFVDYDIQKEKFLQEKYVIILIIKVFLVLKFQSRKKKDRRFI